MTKKKNAIDTLKSKISKNHANMKRYDNDLRCGDIIEWCGKEVEVISVSNTTAKISLPMNGPVHIINHTLNQYVAIDTREDIDIDIKLETASLTDLFVLEEEEDKKPWYKLW